MKLGLNRDAGGGFVVPTLIVLFATVVSGGINLLFQLVMLNLIPSQVNELSALLALLTIITVPSTIVQNVLIRYVSKYKAQNKDGAITWLLRRTLLITIAVGVVAAIILTMALTTPEVQSALKLTSTLAIILTAVQVFLFIVVPVGTGSVQGLQMFLPYGVQSVVNVLLKLGMGIILVLLGFGVGGAMGGIVIGSTFSVVFALFMVRRYLRGGGEKTEGGEIWRFTFPVTIGVLCFTVLTQTDVLLANLVFDWNEANYYAAASTLAKMSLFLPGAVAIVMFPKITTAHAQQSSTLPLMKKAMWLAVLLSGLVAIAFVVAPNFLLNILLPNNHYRPLIAPILQYLLFAMALFGLSNLFMLYGLATDAHAYIAILGLSLVVFFGAAVTILALGVSLTPILLSQVLLGTGLFITILSGAYLIIAERAVHRLEKSGVESVTTDT